MDQRRLGRTGLSVTPIGWGSVKIGRNQGLKYPSGFNLPDLAEVTRLVDGLVDLGINYIDTASAYGLAEQRLGEVIGRRHPGLVISTKVGESFSGGRSHYDFSRSAVTASINRSRRLLGRNVLDVVLIHSNGQDRTILEQTDVVATLLEHRASGSIRAIGLSGKTVEGLTAALGWADVIMVEYNVSDRTQAAVLAKARRAGVGVVVKKGLGSGHLDASSSIRFVLAEPAVASLIIGSLSLRHMRENVRWGEQTGKC